MVETHGRLAVWMEALGDRLGRFAVLAVVLAAAWLPLRLWWLDRDEPATYVVALSGLYGAIWALMGMALDWFSSRREDRRPADPAAARRGAFVALGVGVPFFGAFAVFGLLIGATIFAALFGVLLVGVVASAVSRLRHAARE